MDFSGLAVLLENTAFPILCCAFLAYITYKQSNTLREVADTLERINESISSINNRLDTLERTVDKIDMRG